MRYIDTLVSSNLAEREVGCIKYVTLGLSLVVNVWFLDRRHVCLRYQKTLLVSNDAISSRLAALMSFLPHPLLVGKIIPTINYGQGYTLTMPAE